MQDPFVASTDAVSNRMRSIAGLHDVKKSASVNKIRYARLFKYFNLQMIRFKLSHFPPGMITLIPASRWLFDNYHLLYRTFKAFQASGNVSAFRNLPTIRSGPGEGYPRIYLIAREMINCCNRHLTEESVINMLREYQAVKILKTSELTLFPDILVFCLIEKILEEGKKIIPAIKSKAKADQLIKKIAPRFISGEKDAFDQLKAALYVKDIRDFTFSSHLIYRLNSLSLNRQDVESFLADVLLPSKNGNHDLIKDITEKEKQYETESENIISTLITSLDEMSGIDRDSFFCSVSILEETLGKDPSGAYLNMNGATRARYRKVVADIAHKYNFGEIDIAKAAINLCYSPPANTNFPVPNHIGTYLVTEGKYYLESSFSGKSLNKPIRPAFSKKTRRFLYFAEIIFFTILVFVVTALGIHYFSKESHPLIWLFYLTLVIPASGFAIFIVNTLFTRLVRPLPPLSMNFEKKIPDTARTFIVMPVIIPSADSARAYAASLERHYLANRRENLFFALLVDFIDAKEENLEEDAGILAAAAETIDGLNRKYNSSPFLFSLFYRNRKWNPLQNCWMGRERKRGKIEDFNALLAGEKDTGFILPIGDPSIFPTIRYVITLDSDTELTNESAAELIGVMEHPLNQPVFDDSGQHVKSGYVIVQSEIRNRLHSPAAGVSERIFSGQAGFDPYATVISDVYQDTFEEGIYTGKGIYNLNAFHRILYHKIPDNAVLSHDLLESSMTRCIFAGGIKLMNSVPSSAAAYIQREHRWIRGDWQLLPFLFGKSGINMVSRWKMFDNLRRSLLQLSQLLFITASVLILPEMSWIWIPFLFYEPAFGIFSILYNLILQKIRHPFSRVAFPVLFRKVGAILVQSIYFFILLPCRAYMTADAVLRTLYRLFFSHRNLLEWQTAESVEKTAGTSFISYIRMMGPTLIFSAGILITQIVIPSPTPFKILNLAVLLQWIAAPGLIYLSGKPVRFGTRIKYNKTQPEYLRTLAIKIWSYFVDFTNEEHHWLCPDHHQENPGPKTSDKVSPTNLGMQLLSTISARDLGILGLTDLTELCERILSTVNTLPKWNGHLYNWYDTETLEILEPQYVSTVDSGNFVAHLISLKNGLLSFLDTPVFQDLLFTGLMDLIRIDGGKIEIFDKSKVREQKRKAAGFKKRSLPDKDGIRSEAYTEGIETETFLQKSPADRLTYFYSIVYECYGRQDIGKRTQTFCSGLIRDKECFAVSGLSDLLKTPNEIAEAGGDRAAEFVSNVKRIAEIIDDLVRQTDFSPLYDNKKHLFLIGYHVSAQRPDHGHYNLMASEARLASFLAVAKGDVPKKHWLSLGRPLTLVRGKPALVSWSGSMFEYLMPNLVMNVPGGSVLDYSCRAAVQSQIKYGRKMKLPWGVSESQYHVFDNHSNYQYGPFGVGVMRLQSSLKPVRVVAPYATMLALDVFPYKAVKNAQKLRRMGVEGRYGFYEALDFNTPDPIAMKKFFMIQSFMTHHLGMSMAAINNLLNHNILKKRFHTEPFVKASEYILEETFLSPLVTIASRGYTIDVDTREIFRTPMESRYCTKTGTPYPIAHVLSNGRYQIVLTTQGDGFSSCDDVLMHRWRPSCHSGGYGTFIYIRNPENGQLWSNTFHPTMIEPESYQVIFSHDKAEFRRKDGMISTHTEITVSPVDQFEIRRITLTNHSEKQITLELTSYLEVTANDYLADISHPAYNKLFIETKYDPDRKLLISTRRARKPGEKNGYILHQVRTESKMNKSVRFETSRQAFIGRGGSLIMPEALMSGISFTEKYGTSIDPILCLQVSVSIVPGHSTSVSFITGFCKTVTEVLRLSDRLSVKSSDEDIFNMARTSSLLEIEYLKLRTEQLNAIQDLVGALYYPTNAFKEEIDPLKRNSLGQSGLWRFGISGDNPVMLLKISDIHDLDILRDVLTAYEFLHLQRVRTDLVILNEEESGYSSSLQQLIFEQTSTIRVFDEKHYKAGIFVLKSDQLASQEIDLLVTVARIVFTPKTGIYFARLKASWPKYETERVISLPAGKIPLLEETQDYLYRGEAVPEFFNGIGGFVKNGREYEIRLTNRVKTPVPWINVIANEHFGFQVSETGSGFTWSGNSRENKLTTWYNDPVLDPVSEAIYVKNNDTGSITSPCAMIAGANGPFTVRHGFGYSVFERRDPDLEQSLTVFAALDQPVKLFFLTLKNKTDQEFNMTTACYAEWVLGAFRELTHRYIVTDFDKETGVFSARNVYRDNNKDRLGFLFTSRAVTSFTGDRRLFIGNTGSVRFPYGFSHETLSESVGAGLDPCGVIQCSVHMDPFATETVVFGLGHAENFDQAIALAQSFKDPGDAASELDKVRTFWETLPGKVSVRTPDRAMDIMMNGWLLYQVLVCRYRARAAFYQCGGAFGFRDQLQDVMALMDFDPDITRKHILRCCSRQFLEGDVQHWWHEPEGIGVRTRISDNLLWLPFTVSQYLSHTGDRSLLDEQISFLVEKVLSPGQDELVSAPPSSVNTADVFTHCILAIDYASRFGVHGLPLIKTGDWNDGMNLIGPKEQGESVWLGWFLYTILTAWIPICEQRGETQTAERFSKAASLLQQNLEEHAWDGEWYRRAYFDNGNVLGSAQNEECRIDSISQSWAVISKCANKERAAIALHSARHYLVQPEDNLILLLAPPFDKSADHPGYIRGYNPGIRENGGQYTHAAVWLAMAFCMTGNGTEAYKLLNMMNPIQSTSDFRSVSRYEKEPYVMCADVSKGFPNNGRGGWSWYTGAAGWTYRMILGCFLGLKRQADRLVFEPCVPDSFKRYQVEYQFGESLYEITVINHSNTVCKVLCLSVDGVSLEGNSIRLTDDGAVHRVEVTLENK